MATKRKSTQDMDCVWQGKMPQNTADRSRFGLNNLCNACFTSYDIAIDKVEHLECICVKEQFNNNCQSCVFKKINSLGGRYKSEQYNLGECIDILDNFGYKRSPLESTIPLFDLQKSRARQNSLLLNYLLYLYFKFHLE